MTVAKKYNSGFRRFDFSSVKWSKWVLWFILCFTCFYGYNQRFSDDSWKHTLGSDGIGYYSYLPAAFIHHDFSYSFIQPISKKYPDIAVASTKGFCNTVNGKKVNKYFVGEAVALTPFFLGANLISGSNENPRDGYSFY